MPTGAKLVVIDPIRTTTADAADEFVQPLPGTDIALMLAMMHVLIRDGLVDTDWVAAHTLGFDELADHVADWTPERAGAVCGLDADGHRVARVRLRHDPPGRDPHADRRRAPRERGDVLPHARLLPALVGAWRDRGGGLSRSVGSYHDALIDDAALEPPGPARRSVAADAQHEPAGRGAHRPDPRAAGGGDDRVELQPAGDRAQRRAHSSRPGPRRPVHRRPRAVPHRHGPLRRHRAAGHDADRVDRRRAGVGPPVDGLERGGDRAARRVVQQHRAVPPPRRGDGPHRAGAVRRRRDAARPGPRRQGRPRRAAARRLAARAVPGRRPPVGRRRVPDRRRGRSSW